MKKIVTILGARPQFVKAAVLSRVIKEQGQIEEVIVHTGQHFDANMSAVFFDEMNIPQPTYNLQIHSLSHGAMTGQMLEKIEEILVLEKPDAVLVYGDTNSTLAGALAAKKLHIKVVHIEAGLRSFNMNMPEEINRILTDRISDLLCCPTQIAMENLEKEGFLSLPIQLVNTGDIMKDAVAYYSAFSSSKSNIVDRLHLKPNRFVLATLHRQENTDDLEKLEQIITGLEEIHKSNEVVLPLHPRTKKIMEQHHIHPKVTCIDPLGYFDMLELLKHCLLVVTDSGGLQKEAFFNHKNCIIIREETEWLELVNHGFADIVGTDPKKMQISYRNFQLSKSDFSVPLYGDQVGEKIHEAIINLMKH
jgi:UDP-GlcNAc3NAcA epimerase